MGGWIAAGFGTRSIRGHGRDQRVGMSERWGLEATKARERLEEDKNGECMREPLVRVRPTGPRDLLHDGGQDRRVRLRDDGGTEVAWIGDIGDALDPSAEGPRMAAVSARDLRGA